MLTWPGMLNTWIGNGSVIYVYRKTIRVAPIMDSENWMSAMSLHAVETDECDLDADPGFQGCSSKFSDLLNGKLFKSYPNALTGLYIAFKNKA